MPLKGWITRDVAADLFKSAGFDFADMKKRALQQDFKPIPLGIKASVEIRNKVRTTDSKNVIGVLEGYQDAAQLNVQLGKVSAGFSTPEWMTPRVIERLIRGSAIRSRRREALGRAPASGHR